MKVIERIRLGSRGQGSLLKYAGPANWTFSYYQHGKEHRVTTETDDLKAARRFAKQRLDEVGGDRQGLKRLVTPMASRATMQTLLDAYLADVKLRELKSVSHIVDHARPVATHFGTMRAGNVTSAAIDKYVEQVRTAEKKNATINRQLQIIGAAFKLAVQRKQLTETPLIRKLSERGNVRRVFYEAAEVEAVIAAAPEHLKDVIQFFSLTGLAEVGSRRAALVRHRPRGGDRHAAGLQERPGAACWRFPVISSSS